jgi:hypothetical protein
MAIDAKIDSPAHLKLALQLEGLYVPPSARLAVEQAGRWEPTSNGDASIELELPEGLLALSRARFEAGSLRLETDAAGGTFQIGTHHQRTAVRCLKRPSFYDRQTSSGQTMNRIGHVFGSVLVIGGSAACSYGIRGNGCRFCRVGSRVGAEDSFAFSTTDVVEVVGAALAEGAARFVLFNTGYFEPEDGGLAALGPLVRAVKRQCNVSVGVQSHPPQSLRWIDRIYALGVDAISFSLEVHEPAALELHYPGRARYLGRSRYLKALRYAATIFPRGTVWSEIVVGLEPIESTRSAIDNLVSIGVLPALAPYREGARPQMWAIDPPSFEALLPLYAHLYAAAHSARIPLSRLPSLSFLISPLEARFFAQTDARSAVARQNFHQTRIGAFATRHLARLRRHLRVRQVESGEEVMPE